MKLEELIEMRNDIDKRMSKWMGNRKNVNMNVVNTAILGICAIDKLIQNYNSIFVIQELRRKTDNIVNKNWPKLNRKILPLNLPKLCKNAPSHNLKNTRITTDKFF